MIISNEELRKNRNRIKKDDMELIRAFIAIELSREVREHLAGIAAKFGPSIRSARWARPDATHLTLKFLGDTRPEQVGDIVRALEPAAGGFAQFTLSTGGPGAFPSPKKARVLWLGVNDPSGSCVRLASDIDAAAGALGYEPEKRPFKPHLTLARLREPATLGASIMDYAPDEISFEIKHFVLFRSELKPTGAVYTPLKVFMLA